MRDGNGSKVGSGEVFSPGQPLPPIPPIPPKPRQAEQQEQGQQDGGPGGNDQQQQEEGASVSPREEDFEFAAMLKDMQVGAELG